MRRYRYVGIKNMYGILLVAWFVMFGVPALIFAFFGTAMIQNDQSGLENFFAVFGGVIRMAFEAMTLDLFGIIFAILVFLPILTAPFGLFERTYQE